MPRPNPGLLTVARQRTRVVIGLNSGTSANSIDACLVEIKGQGLKRSVRCLAFRSFLFSPVEQGTIFRFSQPGVVDTETLARFSQKLGRQFARAAQKMIALARRRGKKVDLIGSHGQTVGHFPEPGSASGIAERATLQIGEPEIIAKTTGVVTVADFRPADIAAGGQGAPLSPVAHWALVRSRKKNRVILNIGGIANLTILPKAADLTKIWGFDTGPGNMVIDGLMQRLFGKSRDGGGITAARGKVSKELLMRLKAHLYFHRKPPKTTGREMFGQEFVERCLSWRRKLKVSNADLIATVTELTAWSVWDACQKFIRPRLKIDELFVSGGGARNRHLLQRLGFYFSPVPVKSLTALGLDPQALEAILFALLADFCVTGTSLPLRRITGAKKPVVLGKICQP